MSCGITGIRSGEYVRGIGKQTKNVRFQIEFYAEGVHFYPPIKKIVEMMEIRDLHLFARDCLDWGHFKDLSVKDRVQKIQTEMVDKDLYLSDLVCRIRFLDLGNSEFNGDKISEENRVRLMSGEWLEMKEVYLMFPFTSKGAKRHTLIFRPDNWEIYDPNVQVKYDYYYNLLTGVYSDTVFPGLTCFKAEYEKDGKKIFVGVCDLPSMTKESIHPFIDENIQKEVEWFSPSVYKSLIQKSIRLRPLEVASVLSDNRYPVESVLISAFMLLLKHPGAFVPNLNTFVIGIESAFKRLGVCLLEDSYGTLEAVSSLFLAALASRNGYFPSLDFLNRCIQWMIESLGPRTMLYETSAQTKDLLSENEKRCGAYLEALGSFESDINMVYSVFNLKQEKISLIERPAIMPFYHCLDQHSITEIAYLHMEYVKADVSWIFDEIWEKGTGINSRLKPFILNPYISNAQKWLWILKSNYYRNKEWIELNEEAYYEGKRDIDPSWISGLIGNIPIRIDTKELLCFYNPENLDEVISIRRPSRDGDLLLTPDMQNFAAKKVTLQHSIHDITVHSTLLDLNMKCKYQLGDFLCTDMKGNNPFSWNEYCNSTFKIPFLSNIEIPHIPDIRNFDNMERIVLMASNMHPEQKGVHPEALRQIDIYLEIIKEDRELLMRLGMYLRPIKTFIVLNKINKEGKGSYLMGAKEDSPIFRFLLYLCCIIPGVIYFESYPIGFKIKYFPYWNIIRKRVFSLIEKVPQYDWTIIPNNQRPLRDYQQSAMETILDRINKGKRGHMLWMDVGLGKTLIVLSIVEQLIKEKKMPRYCIFAITPSSEENIRNQIELVGLPVERLDPRGGKKKNIQFKENCIHLIYHDHMDDIDIELKTITNEAFFLFDEVHYMFGNSKRSSVALELAKTCNLFIGMTGTLIRNKDLQKDHIIDWLSQVVDFEIDSTNYMIGVACLVSGKRELPIIQTRNEIEVPMLDPDYYNYVDYHYGGVASKVDYYHASLICFESIYRGIIDRVLYHLNNGIHKCIFVVAKDKKTQGRMYEELSFQGIKCFAIGNGNSISIRSNYNPEGYQVVITTPRLETGYDVTAAKLMITAPYPTNEASRTQLIGRIVRLSQQAPEVFIEILHTGIVSYSMKYHDIANKIAKSLSGMQKNIP